jgi:hypothetical protein
VVDPWRRGGEKKHPMRLNTAEEATPDRYSVENLVE